MAAMDPARGSQPIPRSVAPRPYGAGGESGHSDLNRLPERSAHPAFRADFSRKREK